MSNTTKLYRLKVGQKFLLRESAPSDSKTRYGIYTLVNCYGYNWQCQDQNGENCFVNLDTEVTPLEDV